MFLDRGKRQDAEARLRRGLRDLVYAFLRDRRANAKLFVIAHNVGRIVENTFGCPMRYDAERDLYFSDCPIDGLHSRVGMSVAFTTASRCSVCGADDFECVHVHERVYDGVQCLGQNARVVGVREVSLTPNPDYPETFVRHVGRARTAMEKILQTQIEPGTPLFMHHCRDCLGLPDDGDLDPGLWDLSWIDEGGEVQ
jgi:hypothetical protein